MSSYYTNSTIFDYSENSIDGVKVPLSNFTGKVCLIVNVASACSYTDRSYKELVSLYNKYQNKGLQILAFPCNQFGAQESQPEAAIKQFVTEKYGVTFPMFSKIAVVGSKASDLFNYLTDDGKHEIKWNFCKFLVDKSGKPIINEGGSRVFPSSVFPSQLEERIEKLLEA